MKAAMWSAAAGVLLQLLVGGQPVAAGERLQLASGLGGTPAFSAGVGLSSLIKFELLPRERIDLQAVESPGAIDNLRMLRSGRAELAILPSTIGHAARLGIGSFAGDPPMTGLRAIATLWRDALHLVVREEDVATGTIDDLSRLKDRSLFLGDASSGMADASRLLLADLGMDADDSFKLATIADGNGIAAMIDGEVDAFSATARPPEAMFDMVFKGASPGEGSTSGLRLLDVTESQMARANGNHWLWTPYVIAADTYPGQTDDVWTIGLSNLLVVRADVDPDVVHAMTKSIFENLSYLKRIDPLMADLSLETALAGMAMPLHPGALRYYEEAGLIPKAGSAVETSPTLREGSEPEVTPERYPDGDVAGDWPYGAGGPLLRAKPPRTAPATAPHWRRRATL
ncbi:MAG: TAXI family TRAP transporter solute-binding subunit [Geminicoccaceae bacterium]